MSLALTHGRVRHFVLGSLLQSDNIQGQRTGTMLVFLLDSAGSMVREIGTTRNSALPRTVAAIWSIVVIPTSLTAGANGMGQTFQSKM